MMIEEGPNIKRIFIQSIFILFALVLLGRLFVMQVLDGSYEVKAQRNVVRYETIYPSRGQIFDRRGRLVVNNQAVYDLMMVPRQVKNLDTSKLCKLLEVSKDDFNKSIIKMRRSKGYSAHKPQVLFKQIPKETYSRVQEYLYQFPGFYPQVRTVRSYPYHNASHVLGYIGEVNQKQIDTTDYYKLGDYVGIDGIERTYEKTLRGEKGIRALVVDVLNREIGSYKDGKEDKPAITGQDLTLTLDIKLQTYAERLMNKKLGSVVAIEPATGEILALVSSPSYDPNLLAGGRQRGAAMRALTADTLKPLYNRALKAPYPPGSTFKPLMALMALQERVIGNNYYYGCHGGYRLGRRRVGCHGHAPAYGVVPAIQHSCNAYFCQLFKLFVEQDKYENVAEGLTRWGDYLREFGLGTNMSCDVPIDRLGLVPDTALYDKMYKGRKWRSTMIISVGIGQGELGVTPLQMAHFTAVIANRGQYFYPHIVRPLPSNINSIYRKPQKINIDRRHFETIVKGMERVVTMGTAKVAYVPELSLCGKTGTAENPHGKDHSLFIGFGPKEKPKIAIAVMVENSGFGSRFAAPIASLLMEQYLNDSIMDTKKRRKLEEKMLEADLIDPVKRRKYVR